MSQLDYCKIVDEHRQRVGSTKVAVAAMLGITENSAANKLGGKTEFALSEIRTLADKWGMTIDELVGH